MSTLLYTLGRWSYRHPWRVLVAWLLLLGIAGGGALAFSKGTDNSFTIPGTEAQAGIEQLNRTFPQVSGTSAQIVLVAADGDSVRDEPYVTAIADAVADLAEIDGVLAVTGPFDEMVAGLVTDDDSAAIIRLQFDGAATEVPQESKDTLTASADALEAELPAGSQLALGGDLFSISVPGITVTELVGIVIALLVLMVTFRSFLVAGLPLATAIIGVGLSMALILLATVVASITSTTPLLALMLGLAVGIDYALFIVARHQDQVRAGIEPEESVARATGTAGSAVVFAGVTVLIALIGLGLAGIPFLTTMGIAASVSVAIAVAVAITLTPALLGFVKGRVVGRAPKQKRSSRTRGGGFASRWVTGVTRHPVITTVAVVVGLGVLAIPASSLALALPNAGVQAESSPARQSYDLTAEHFGPGFNGPLVMTGTIVTSTDPLGLMDDLAAEIEKIPGVAEIALATPNETADTGIIQIIPETAPDDPATADLVRELRAQHDRLLEEYGVDLTVTGFTAVGIDISDRLGAALLPFGIFVVGLSFILLMIVFRSIAVPITAALGYLLSVAAAFGAVAAVFEWGWFADALHIARTGPVISFMPIILMGVLFGLAMDYQVFLVSRMREDYVHASRARGGRADRATAISAIRSGFTSSARVVTAAALIMLAVFAAFVPEGDSSIKPIAFGLAAGIAIDAFLVRMTLIPAVMALLGEKAWWMPRWLDRVLPHFDIEGEAVERELALADWPEPATTAAVVGERVSLHADGGRSAGDVALFEDASFRLESGGTLIVTGEPRATRAFALVVSGRLAPTDGLLRVGGHLLPGRAAWVRAHVGLALLAGSDDRVGEVRRALGGRTGLVVIEGIDSLDAAERDQVAALLRDATAGRAGDDLGPLTVVATARSDGGALALVADAGRPAIDLARPSRRRLPHVLPLRRGTLMTLPLERSRSPRPITWLTLLGVLLLPVVIGGILVAALYNPAERLDNLSAAIVNEDDPVTIDGQLVPLGRQLTAGLVEGTDDLESNLDWTISNPEDAAAGLDDGTYAAVITIPQNFSAAATSTQPGSTPDRAMIEVQTPPDSLVVDDAITAQLAQAAASLMGDQLSKVYLENVLLGFTTLGEELGTASDGAVSLADGAAGASEGAMSLADGVAQLSGGATQLSTGLSQWSAGATEASAGLQTWAAGAQTLSGSTQQIADGIGQIGAGLAQAPQIPSEMIDVANQLAANTEQIKSQATDAAARLATLAAECVAQGAPQQVCDGISEASDRAADALPTVTQVIDQTGTIAAGVEGMSQLPALGQTLTGLSGNLNQVAGGMSGLAAGATQAADGVAQLASGAGELAAGGGALSSGAATAADGASQLADGVSQLADGTGELAGRPGHGIRDHPVLHRRRGERARERRRRSGGRRGRRQFAVRRLCRAAAGDACTVVRRPRHVRRASGGVAPRADLAHALGAAGASGLCPRGCDRRGAGPARGGGRAAGSVLRLGPVVGLRRSVHRRRRRVRRRQPGPCRRLRRSRSVGLGAGRRPRRGHRRRLDGTGRAVGHRRGPAHLTGLPRHGRCTDVGDRRRSSRRGTHRVGGALDRRDDRGRGPTPLDHCARAAEGIPSHRVNMTKRHRRPRTVAPVALRA